MNPQIGWTLAVVATALAWYQYGWQGVILAISVIVFWLLLQFSRALRVLRQASARPVGTVPNAVMLHSKLRAGLRLASASRHRATATTVRHGAHTNRSGGRADPTAAGGPELHDGRRATRELVAR